jgi:hypothetical protein
VIRELYRTFKYNGKISFEEGFMSYGTMWACQFWVDYSTGTLGGKKVIGVSRQYQPIYIMGGSVVEYVRCAPTYDWIDI